MEKKKHFEGKGEFDYDYANDILFFKTKDRDYDSSIEADRFMIDIDKEGFIVGIQIFNASEMLGIDKIKLRQVRRWRFGSVAL